MTCTDHADSAEELQNANFLPSDNMIESDIFRGYLLTWDFIFSRKRQMDATFYELLNVSIDGQESTVMTRRLRRFN